MAIMYIIYLELFKLERFIYILSDKNLYATFFNFTMQVFTVRYGMAYKYYLKDNGGLRSKHLCHLIQF